MGRPNAKNSAVPGEPNSQFQRLVTAGVIAPALENGDPLEQWPDIRLPIGTATRLIDSDRDEA